MSSLKKLFRDLAVAAALLAAAAATRAQLAVGDAFPPLVPAQLEGAPPDLAGRVAVVDLWASWCAPCKAAFPALGQLQRDFAAQDVVVLGVSVDERAKDYAAFLKKLAPPFATVRDRDHALVAALKPAAMPTTFVLGRDGRVRAILTGYHGKETERALRAAVAAALAH